MVSSSLVFFALVAVSSVFAHPIHHARELRIMGREHSAIYSRRAEGAGNGTASVSNFDALSTGNQKFRDNIAKDNPKLLQNLADEGQGVCVDSKFARIFANADLC